MSIADKLKQISDNVPKVFKAGKKAECDAFWDSYQNNGNRKDYSHAFGGEGWNNDTFKPEYSIAPTNAYMIFRQCDFEGDLVSYLGSLGVLLDFSNATNTAYMFALASKITHIGEIDARNTKSSIVFDTCFQNCSALKTIDKLVFERKQENKAEFSASSFTNCTALENITMDGEIANNGLNLQHSAKLSKASIENIIDCLSKSSSGKAITLSRKAVENAFVDTDGEQAEISISDKQIDGFYIVTFGSREDENSLLKFAAPMDISLHGVTSADGEIFEADISRSGIYSLSMWEEVTFTATSGSTYTAELSSLLYEGGPLKIKRTDGKDLSSGDVSAYMRDEYNYEWFDLIATKPNWDIILI